MGDNTSFDNELFVDENLNDVISKEELENQQGGDEEIEYQQGRDEEGEEQ